ncbi:MAG: acetyl-CoA C-acyltransferase [Gammaproteobacteria bacterium]
MNDPIVIVSAVRTPIGKFLGSLKDVTAPQLGATAVKAAVERAGVEPEKIEEVLLGCVLTAGVGQAPARQAAIGAGLPPSTGAVTINKVCGSGLKATMLAHDLVQVGTNQILLAGGMESMSNAPYLLPKARVGYRMGHQTALDHMIYDGLEDAYHPGKLMGYFAEECATQFKFSRQAQDDFALLSLERARRAWDEGAFQQEVVEVNVKTAKDEKLVVEDEGPITATPYKIPTLKPAFVPNGTITAANSSSISDGAAALVLMRCSLAKKLNIKPLATIIGHSTCSQAPPLFTTAPIGAIQRLLDKIKWTIKDVDLFEINEAFAVVVMAAMKELQLPVEKINVNGGACALGHPIGASGARILVTLIHALYYYHLKRGIAAICLGGGEAVAMAIEI